MCCVVPCVWCCWEKHRKEYHSAQKSPQDYSQSLPKSTKKLVPTIQDHPQGSTRSAQGLHKVRTRSNKVGTRSNKVGSCWDSLQTLCRPCWTLRRPCTDLMHPETHKMLKQASKSQKITVLPQSLKCRKHCAQQ